MAPKLNMLVNQTLTPVQINGIVHLILFMFNRVILFFIDTHASTYEYARFKSMKLMRTTTHFSVYFDQSYNFIPKTKIL